MCFWSWITHPFTLLRLQLQLLKQPMTNKAKIVVVGGGGGGKLAEKSKPQEEERFSIGLIYSLPPPYNFLFFDENKENVITKKYFWAFKILYHSFFPTREYFFMSDLSFWEPINMPTEIGSSTSNLLTVYRFKIKKLFSIINSREWICREIYHSKLHFRLVSYLLTPFWSAVLICQLKYT